MQLFWSSKIAESVPATLKPWLSKAYSLHRQLKQSGAAVLLERLSEKKGKFTASEQHILLESQGWVREICHQVNGQRVIYGRVAIPQKTYELMQQELSALGDRPIGDTLLFHHRGVRRGRFEFAVIDAKEADYHIAFQVLGIKKGKLWARRSIFYWYEQPLIITEIFVAERLPEFHF